jgi:hypothetical protein
MKKLALMLLTLAAFGILAVGCSSTTETDIIDPSDLKPPLGLVSFAGDQQVTLAWDSANSEDDSEKYPITGFSIYMASGDLSASDCAGPISKEQLVEDLADDDFPICGDLGEEFSQGGALTEGGGILPVLLDDMSEYTVPGPVSRIIINGEAMSDLFAIEAAADDDDDDDEEVAADDDDDDEGALVYPSATTGGEATEPPADEDAGSGEIELANGTTYTFFVTVRSESDYSAESYTSNWVAETPRKGVDGVTMAIDDCYDLDGLGEAVACVDDDGAADISISGWYMTGTRPRVLINGINDAQIMDAGAVDSFDDVGEAAASDSGAYLDTGVGVIARPGHVYVIYTNSGYYGKVLVSEMTNMVDLMDGTETVCVECSPTVDTTLTVQGALQTEGRLMK